MNLTPYSQHSQRGRGRGGKGTMLTLADSKPLRQAGVFEAKVTYKECDQEVRVWRLELG